LERRAPGHHGYQRACDLLNGQALAGHLGHQCSHAPGRPNLHLSYFEGFWPCKTPGAHNQFGTARLVVLQVLGDLTVHHLTLAPTNRCHVDGDGACHCAVLSALARNMGYFALAISFLLGMQAMLGQEPPIQRRSTTAPLCPDCAMCQAKSLPPVPLPRTRTSNRST
jgi:hypothetical protein